MWTLLLLLVAPLTGTGEVVVAPDLVTLNNGKSLEGRVVFEDEQQLVLRVKSRERVIEQDSIAAVRAAIRELPWRWTRSPPSETWNPSGGWS